ncbi:DUF1684 domain-containing protein [Arthrobacter monumenti]
MSEPAASVPTIDQRTFMKEWKAWHLTREAKLAEPFGWLSVTAMHWLSSDPQKYDGVPGTWSSDRSGIVVELDEGEELFVEGEPVSGRYAFGTLHERESVTVRTEAFAVEIARRGGYCFLRPRHPDAPALDAFKGVATFEPDPRWQFAGRFRADRHTVTVGSVVRSVHHEYLSPGTIEFTAYGQTQRLTAFPGTEPDSFQVLFTDGTSGASTSSLCRALYIPAPDEDGNVMLDFNRAVNMPCSFTGHATCPLPPSENRLPFAVEAGEKEY